MKPTNRHGTPVDPVPFLVVGSLAFLLSFSYGPIYLLALGYLLPVALALSGVLFALAAGAAYHRMILAARPELRGEIPPEQRLRRLIRAVTVVVALLVLLSLPFFVP